MNRRRWIALLPALSLLALPGIAQAQDDANAKPLLQTLFTNNDPNGWTVFGQNAKLKVVKDEARPGTDKNVLQFDYGVNKGEMNLMLLNINDNEVAAAHSIRFQVKSDYATTVAMALQEREGGRWVAMFHVPANKWQEVVLAPSDFQLGRGETDPPDPNGKLDMDLVNFAGIIDINQLFSQSGDTNILQLFGIKMGAHSLWLGDFAISRTLVPTAISQSDPRLDSFAAPQVSWMTVGGMEVTNTSGKPLEGKGISATYRQTPDRIAGLIRSIPQGKLAGKTAIKVTLASEKAAKVMVQLEERGGGKYNAIISVPAGSTATTTTIKFADLIAANDSKDDNGKFDPDKVYQILVADLSGMFDKADGPNTLLLGDLRTE